MAFRRRSVLLLLFGRLVRRHLRRRSRAGLALLLGALLLGALLLGALLGRFDLSAPASLRAAAAALWARWQLLGALFPAHLLELLATQRSLLNRLLRLAPAMRFGSTARLYPLASATAFGV